MAIGNLASALQDVRQMRRTVALRSESDPEVVAETLDTILREAIAVRTASGGRLGRGAENELKNIRNALLANKIDAGSKSTEFVGKYSAIVDQLERAKPKKEGPGIASGIAQNLPSGDALLSALTTANPILGYTAKIGRDSARGLMSMSRRKRESKRLEMESLVDQRTELTNEAAAAPEGSKEKDEIVGKLDLIDKQLGLLVKIWSDGDERLERIVEESTETSTRLERIQSESEETSRLQRINESRGRLKAAELGYEGKTFGAGNLGSTLSGGAFGGDENKPLDMSQLGLFSGMGGALGASMGAIATKMLSPFVGLWNFVKRGSTILGKLGRGSVILTALYSMYDFFDGFLSASEFLEGDDVSMGDRLRSGMSQVISGLLWPVDWVLDFFDMGFMEDKDSFTAKLLNSENQLLQFFLSPGVWVSDFIESFDFEKFKTDLKEKIMEPIDFFLDFFNRIGESVTGWIDDKVDGLKNSWLGDVLSPVFDNLNTESSITEGINQNGVYFRGMPTTQGSGATSQEETAGAVQDLGTMVITASPEPTLSERTTSTIRETNDQPASSSAQGAGSNIFAPSSNTNNNYSSTTITEPSSPLNDDATWRRFNSDYLRSRY